MYKVIQQMIKIIKEFEKLVKQNRKLSTKIRHFDYPFLLTWKLISRPESLVHLQNQMSSTWCKVLSNNVPKRYLLLFFCDRRNNLRALLNARGFFFEKLLNQLRFCQIMNCTGQLPTVYVWFVSISLTLCIIYLADRGASWGSKSFCCLKCCKMLSPRRYQATCEVSKLLNKIGTHHFFSL